jgi:hypothetical protein
MTTKPIKSIEGFKAKNKVVRNMANNRLYYNFGYYPNGIAEKEGVYILCDLFKQQMFAVNKSDYHKSMTAPGIGSVPRFLEVQEPPKYNPFGEEPNKASELYYATGQIKLKNKDK